MRDLQFHDIDLGEPLSDDRIAAEIHSLRTQPGLKALLQRARNESCRLQTSSYDEARAGNASAAQLDQGGAQALYEMFTDLVKWTREKK
jgi:hypothetical protein